MDADTRSLNPIFYGSTTVGERGQVVIPAEARRDMGISPATKLLVMGGPQKNVLIMAKGIASGIPFGVMMAREHIMTWPRGAHGNTYGGNPIACAAALVTIDLIEKEYLWNTNEVGAYAKHLLEEIKYRHPSIGDVRGMGLMLGVEFIQDPETIKPAESLRDGVINKAFERGLLLLGCGKSTIRIAPPLSVTKDEVEAALMIFEEAITIAEQESSFLYVA